MRCSAICQAMVECSGGDEDGAGDNGLLDGWHAGQTGAVAHDAENEDAQ